MQTAQDCGSVLVPAATINKFHAESSYGMKYGGFSYDDTAASTHAAELQHSAELLWHLLRKVLNTFPSVHDVCAVSAATKNFPFFKNPFQYNVPPGTAKVVTVVASRSVVQIQSTECLRCTERIESDTENTSMLY